MSRYKTIQTEFRHLESLKAALLEILGSPEALEVAKDPRTSTLPLYGYVGDQRLERVGLRIPRQHVNRFSGGSSNDIGFAWDGRSFTAIVSEYDQGNPGSKRLLNQVRQTYALHEVRRQAHAKGYTVQQHAGSDGSIQLTLVRR